MEGVLMDNPRKAMEELDNMLPEIFKKEDLDWNKSVNLEKIEEFQNELDSYMEDISDKKSDNEDLGDENSDYLTPFCGVGLIHKTALKYAFNNLYLKAIKTCEKGLVSFPNDKTLLSDLISFHTHIGEFTKAKKFYKRLEKGLKMNKWSEQCFTNCIYYLIMASPEENKSKIENLLSEYKKYYPECDGLSLSESDYQSELGNILKARNILEERIAKPLKNAPRCALKLMQMQLKEGEFEKAKYTGDYFDVARVTAEYLEIAESNNLKSLLINYSYTKCKIADAIMHLHTDDENETIGIQLDLLKNQYKELLGNSQIAMNYGYEIQANLEGLRILV